MTVESRVLLPGVSRKGVTKCDLADRLESAARLVEIVERDGFVFCDLIPDDV